MAFIDKKRWLAEFKHPDWYVYLKNDYLKLLDVASRAAPEERAAMREELYSFVEESLRDGKILLAQNGPNRDEERKPIDTIVIHHTHHAAGMTRERLSAIHLIRLYSGYHTEMNWKPGEAVWSNHFNEKGEQVFYAYHWFVHQDGSRERLLKDSEIGRHAGNWNTNCRSVGICIDDNLDEKVPSDVVLDSIVEIIKEYYPTVVPSQIIGHREVNPKTNCPGDRFLGGWKETLLDLITKN